MLNSGKVSRGNEENGIMEDGKGFISLSRREGHFEKRPCIKHVHRLYVGSHGPFGELHRVYGG